MESILPFIGVAAFVLICPLMMVAIGGIGWLVARARGQKGSFSSCLTGHVLGIASAASITNFIDSTLPYFVALSIVSMVAWLIWLLRDRGFTLPTLGQTVWRHGIALGGAYGTVFGASMALTVVMGLQ